MDQGFNGYDSLSYMLYDGQSLSEEVTAVFYVDQNTSINNNFVSSKNKINLSPNPCDDYLNVRSENSISSIQIFNSNGRLEKSVNFNSSELTINVSDLSAGIYYIVFKVGESIQSSKFIKK